MLCNSLITTKIYNMKFFLVLLFSFTAIFFFAQKSTAQNVSVNFQVFFDELSPYGMWVNNADYGYVWVPNVDKDFRPYGTNGYWVYTAEGWTWVSDYPWGWAPFHYGSWYYDQIYGSIWVPDNVWGPGWVDWRRAEGYYGWCPMRPVFGMGHSIRNMGWRFVRNKDFGRRDIHNYYINNHTAIYKNSTAINNVHIDKVHNVSYNAGPDRKEIEKHLGKKVAQIDIKENTAPGQHLNNNQLEMYRPTIEKANAQNMTPAPNKLTNIKDVKRRDQKIPKSQAMQPTSSPAANPVEPVKQPIRQITKPETKIQLPPQKIDKPIKQPAQPITPVKQKLVKPPVRQESVQPPMRHQTLPPKIESIKPLPQRKEQPKASIPASPEQYKQPVRNRIPTREVPEPQPLGTGEQIHH